MEKPTKKAPRTRPGTKHKYTQCIYRIISLMAQQQGQATSAAIDAICREMKVSDGITVAMVKAGLATKMRKGVKGRKGSTVTYYITQRALSGDYRIQEVINNYLAEVSENQPKYRQRAMEKQENRRLMDALRPQPSPQAPPPVTLAPPVTQMGLFEDPGQHIRLTWAEWTARVEASGYIIAKPVSWI